MDSERTAREVEQAQQIASLSRELNALRSLLAAIVEAWREPNCGIGRMVRLVEAAEKTLLTIHESGVH